MNIKTFAIAAGLVTVVSSQAVAQGRTDSPNTGSGSALTSTVVFNPMPVKMTATSNGFTVRAVNGQRVTVTQEVGRALTALVSGNALSTEARSALVTSFGGGNAGGALVDAMAALASEGTPTALAAAIRAYNAAVNAGPENPPAGLIAARAYLANVIAN